MIPKDKITFKRSGQVLPWAIAGLLVIILLFITVFNGSKKVTTRTEAQLDSTVAPETTQVANNNEVTAAVSTTVAKIDPVLSYANPVRTVVGNAIAVQVAANKEALAKLQEQLNTITAKPFTITYNDQSWKVPVDRLKKLVKIDKYAIEIDRGGLADILKGWAKPLEKKPVDAQIMWSDKDNKVVARKPSVPGQKLDVEPTLDGIKAAMLKGETQAPMLIVPDAPKVDSEQLDKLGIKEKISEGVSSFAGSDNNRAHNINTGADFIDNTLVPPRGIFSFNQAVGPITKERGFADGYAIVGDKTETDVGGGICQVSTTTFRAAFYAGFTINERHPHLYRVTWYESLGEAPGFDATIYQPGSDFRFTNETDSWLLLSTYVYKNGTLKVVLYGTKPNWQVEMTPGSGKLINETAPPPPKYEVDQKLAPGTKKKVDSAHKGFDTFIGRIVKGSDGQIVRQDKFNSHYVAWPDMYKVGPDPTTAAKPSPGNTTPAADSPAATTAAPAATTPAAPGNTTASAQPTSPAPKPTTEAPPQTTAAPHNDTAPPNQTTTK